MTKKVRSLRATLLRGVFIPTSLVVLILVGITLFAAHLIYTGIVERQHIVGEAVAFQSDQFLHKTERILQRLTQTLQDLPRAQQQIVLQNELDIEERFATLYILDADGYVVAGDKGVAPWIGLDFSGKPSYTYPYKPGGIYFGDTLRSPITGNIVVIIAAPLFDAEQLQGILVGELNVTFFHQVIEKATLDQNLLTFVVDSKGRVIAHQNPNWAQEQRNLGNSPLFKFNSYTPRKLHLFYDPWLKRWVMGSVHTTDWHGCVITLEPALVLAGPLLLFISTTKQVGAGTGLGLWVCWAIISERHKGKIWTEPVLDITTSATIPPRITGTRFVIELPISQ